MHDFSRFIYYIYIYNQLRTTDIHCTGSKEITMAKKQSMLNGVLHIAGIQYILKFKIHSLEF